VVAIARLSRELGIQSPLKHAQIPGARTGGIRRAFPDAAVTRDERNAGDGRRGTAPAYWM